jgi:hypothetical protein
MIKYIWLMKYFKFSEIIQLSNKIPKDVK